MTKLIALLLVACAIMFAPAVKADDCGHYETRYRIEQVYVPPVIVGYTVQGYPIYSEGYYSTRYIPYTVWVSRPCYPRSRYYAPRHRTRINIGFGIHF